jgi:ubiquinone/menaquinone biosynthesis C-methylase UbiE
VSGISSIPEVREFYNAVADTYAKMMGEEIKLPMYDRVLSHLASQIEGIEGFILDTSCGSGHMLEELGTRYAPNRERVGIDLSPEMVGLAARRLGDTVSVSQGDMRKLDAIADDSCAAVLSFFALHHVDLDTVEACFIEWYRVLKPGGCLLVVTWEGEGQVDYGDQTDVVAYRYKANQLADRLGEYQSQSSQIERFEEMEMDAIIIEATK